MISGERLIERESEWVTERREGWGGLYVILYKEKVREIEKQRGEKVGKGSISHDIRRYIDRERERERERETERRECSGGEYIT